MEALLLELIAPPDGRLSHQNAFEPNRLNLNFRFKVEARIFTAKKGEVSTRPE
jgi:hypothetical protein